MEVIISVIIPVYNAEKYIRKCINSLLGQQDISIEIILVDDGSKDASGKICDEYSEKYSNVKVIHKKNERAYKARKVGLDAAKGKYISFIDSDDWIEKDMFSILSKIVMKEYDLILFPYCLDYGNRSDEIINKFAGKYDKEEINRIIFPKLLYWGKFYQFGIEPSLCNKLIKKEIIVYDEFDDRISVGEDGLVLYSTIQNAKSIYFYNEKVLYHYRQNNDSITQTYRQYYLEENIRLFQKLETCFSKENIPNIEEQLNYYILFLTQLAIENEMLSPKFKIFECYKRINNYCKSNQVRQAIKNVRISDVDMPFRKTFFFLKYRGILFLILMKKIRRVMR